MCVTGARTIAIVVVRGKNDEEPGSATHIDHEVTGSFEFFPSTLHPLIDPGDGAAAVAIDRVVNLDGRDVHATADTVDLTPLQLAAPQGDLCTVERLLGHGADLNAVLAAPRLRRLQDPAIDVQIEEDEEGKKRCLGSTGRQPSLFASAVLHSRLLYVKTSLCELPIEPT